ncbi:MAG: hypothetical protein ABI426_02990 [Flavobacterium sp.]
MLKEVQTKSNTDYKITKLIFGIIFDLIGMMSYIFPGIAEVTDVIWAPIGAFILSRMYKGTVGKVGGIIEFLEEIIPATDIIPTFTLVWFYEYYIAKRNE